jgi:hypothetical protein
MAFSNTSDGWITGHLADMIEVQREHQCVAPHSCCGQRCLDAGMAGTDDYDVINPHVSRETNSIQFKVPGSKFKLVALLFSTLNIEH